MAADWVDVYGGYVDPWDLRDLATEVCLKCGGGVFVCCVWFDNNEIVGIDSRVMVCMTCGSYYKVPLKTRSEME